MTDLDAHLEAVLASRRPVPAGHGMDHVRRVVQNARRICEIEGGDLDVVTAAAWLHDVAHGQEDHAAAAAGEARCILAELGFSADKTEAVAVAVRDHSWSAGRVPETLEGRILTDADRLDAIGAVGVARCLAVGTAHGRALYHPEDPLARSGRPPDDSRWTLDHFPRKLLHLAGTLHTETARRMAVRRHRFLLGFLHELGRDLGLDRTSTSTVSPLETCPGTYDLLGYEEGSEDADCDVLEGIFARHGLGAGPLLDVACGTGRHAVALAARAYEVVGVDRVEAALVEARRKAAWGPPGATRFLTGDAVSLPLAGPFAAAYLLFNTLMAFTDNDDVLALFHEVHRVLARRGLFVIDGFAFDLWEEVAEGNYATGVNEDGTMQMIWLPGRNVFALRRDEAVDEEDYELRPDDALYRLYSLDEIDLVARASGFTVVDGWEEGEWLVMRKDR